MKTLKHFLYYTTVFFIITFSFTGCFGDEDAPENLAGDTSQVHLNDPILGGDDSVIAYKVPEKYEPLHLEKLSINDQWLDTLTGSDFLSYEFSPDSKKLAFAKLVKGDPDLSEIGTYDFNKKTLVTLVPAKSTKKYSRFGAYANDIKWLDQNKLLAKIDNGEVGYTEVEIDARTGRIIKSKYFGEQEVDYDAPKALSNTILSNYPGMREPVLQSAKNNAFFTFKNDEEIVLQFNHVDTDFYVHYLNLPQKQSAIILKLPKESIFINSLKSAHLFNNEVFFVISDRKYCYLYRYRKNSKVLDLIYKDLTGTSHPRMKILYQQKSNFIFLLEREASFKSGHNPIFYSQRGKISEITNYTDISGAKISGDGNLIAFSRWHKNKRTIWIHKMQLP